jgi:hypothetical protein
MRPEAAIRAAEGTLIPKARGALSGPAEARKSLAKSAFGKQITGLLDGRGRGPAGFAAA